MEAIFRKNTLVLDELTILFLDLFLENQHFWVGFIWFASYTE
jgi:hypothetical protein